MPRAAQNNPQVPARLYKYLPSRFADNFVRRGDVLFRNLAYFRKVEDRGRNDLLEGLHMDHPDNPITIEAVDGRVRWQGNAAFLNSIDPQRLLNPRQIAFCKHEAYSHQREYRLAVPLRGALKLTRRIVNELFSFDEEIAAGAPDERHVIIGSISDIATIHARYEQGASVPTVEKLDQLLQAVSGGRDFVLLPSAIEKTARLA